MFSIHSHLRAWESRSGRAPQQRNWPESRAWGLVVRRESSSTASGKGVIFMMYVRAFAPLSLIVCRDILSRMFLVSLHFSFLFFAMTNLGAAHYSPQRGAAHAIYTFVNPAEQTPSKRTSVTCHTVYTSSFIMPYITRRVKNRPLFKTWLWGLA